MGNIFHIIGEFLTTVFAAESVVQAGGAVPAKIQGGSTGGHPFGIVGVVMALDDPAKIAAVQAAAMSAHG
jgi:hypothetical protein